MNVISVNSTDGNSLYKAGSTISITVTFSGVVAVTGTPQLYLAASSGNPVAQYQEGTGTEALIFVYTVQVGDNSAHLDYVGIDSLNPNGGSITDNDASGPSADLTLPAPSEPNSLGALSNIVVDTLAPAAPGAPVLAAISDTGASDSDGITSVTNPTLSGVAEANSTVVLYDGATELGRVAASSGGAWTITLGTALTQATHAFTVQAIDAAGNTSAASAPRSVTVDTTMPAAASVPHLATASDTGASSTDRITSRATPTLTGTAEAGATVKIYDTGNLALSLGQAVADGSGNWSITTTTLAQGSRTLVAKATDVAGNTGVASASLGVMVDTTAPVFSAATVNGNSLVLTYTDGMALDATHAPAAGAFAVVAGGSGNAVTGAAVVDATAHTVTLTLTTAVVAGQAVTVAYTDPTVGDDANAIQDVAGNDAISLVATTVVNATPAPAPAPAPVPSPAPAPEPEPPAPAPAPPPAGVVVVAPEGGGVVRGGAGPDRLTGLSGGDTFFPGGGADTINGGGGTDTVVLAGDRSQYALLRLPDGSVVVRSLVDGTSVVTLQNVERLQFDGNKLALDLGVGESGGKTALALGAVFGLQGLSDKGLVGQLLAFFDAGHSWSDAAALAVNSGLIASRAGGAGNAAFVDFVYRAVTGQVPDAGTAGVFRGWLDSGAMSQIDLLALALQHPVNQVQVNLVGLSSVGLVF